MNVRRLLRLIGSVFVGGALAWAAGFFLFLNAIALYTEPTIDSDLAPTDAIVVLTGGSERIGTGIDLLKAGKGKKLFVSGVYPGLSLSQIVGKSTLPPDLRDCCVALGHAADNTYGNVGETKAWLDAESFKSFRLVTAHYHMPRSLLLFRNQMPDMLIVPHPVVPESVQLQEWWMHVGTTHLLLTEYNKYLYAALRSMAETLP